MHSSISDRQEVFSREMIVGHAAVGIQELRCTGGAGETTIPVEVVAHSPAD